MVSLAMKTTARPAASPRLCALQPIGRQAGYSLDAADRQLTAESAVGPRWTCPRRLPEVRVTADLYANHIAGKDTLPTFAPGPALGGGAGVVIGSDVAMTLTMVSLGGPVGLFGTVQFGALWQTQPKLSGPMPTSQTMATPPPVGLAGAVSCRHHARTDPVFATTAVPPGIYSFSPSTVVG